MKKKVICGAVALALVATGTLAMVANNSARADEAKTTTVTSGTGSNTLVSNLMDETVYVFLDADGKVKKTISSDWTKNDLGADVYTKTEGKATVPVTVGVSYYLDGKKVSAEEIRGRSGHFKIRYDYTNTERVDGVYMPYVVLSGAVLSNEHFANVAVTNGKLVNDGTRLAVVGVGLPGMKENLGVNIDLPEFVEIEGDTKEFKMEMTATLATAQIFAGLDTSMLSSVDALSSQLNTLSSAMLQLMDGSVQLRDGLATLNSKSGVLADGVGQLRAGSLKLVDGMSSLSDGLASAYAGSKELATGLSSAYEGSKTLVSGVADAAKGAKDLDAGVDQLVASINQLAGGFTELNAGGNNTKLISGATTAFNNTLDGLKANPATAAIFADVTLANFPTKVAAMMEAYGGNAEIKNYLELLSLYIGVINYISGVNQIAAGAAAAPEKVAPLKEGTSKLSSGLSAMNEKVPELSNGLNKLSSGASTLSDGLSSASAGSKELATGMASLDAGISNLASNVPALTDGVSKLYSGSTSLSDGLSQFNSEGVQRLVSLYNGDIRALVSRIQAMVDVAKKSGTKTKYIYRTDEI